jgi:uncharacterized protein YdaU (DUF1376 family)
MEAVAASWRHGAAGRGAVAAQVVGESLLPKEKVPAFQFYPKDFLTDSKVVRMSNTEVGIYVRLLCYCWLDGDLPLETEALASMARMPIKQFTKLWENSIVKTCFHLGEDGRLHQKRLDEERTKQDEFRRRQSDNGRLGGRPQKPTFKPNETQNNPGLLEIKPKKSSPISDLHSTPQPPSGGLLADEDIATKAGDFLRRYPGIYARAKAGANYHVREARDFPLAMELVTQWPDLAHLEKMLELFLRKADWSPKNVPGSPGQFRHMAPECDALLRKHGHAPVASRVAS